MILLQLREEVAKAFDTSVASVCLIFAGKILKDGETLEQHGVKDGIAVHLVIKSTNQVFDCFSDVTISKFRFSIDFDSIFSPK